MQLGGTFSIVRWEQPGCWEIFLAGSGLQEWEKIGNSRAEASPAKTLPYLGEKESEIRLALFTG